VTAALYRARRELRRDWRATLALIVLVAVVGGVVLATAAGARRSSTAYERLREETLASDLDVAFADTEGPPTASVEDAARRARSLPQVAALSRLDFPFLVPAGSGFYPYLDFLAGVRTDGAVEAQVDRPRVLDGRLPSVADAGEVAISVTYAGESGLGVGDRQEFESYAPAQLEQLFTTGDAGPPAGPRFALEVTAVFDAPIFLSESTGDFQPRIMLSPAFLREHGDEVATYPGGFAVRLHGGAADATEVTQELRAMFPEQPLEITPADEVDRKIGSGIRVAATALALCSMVAALAGGTAVAQALSRHFATRTPSHRWLGVLGMTRSERLLSQTLTTVPVATIGALGAVALSILASPRFPVGIARRAEPDPGLAVDVTVALFGAAGIFVAVLALTVLAASAAARGAVGGSAARRASSLPSRSMTALRYSPLTPARAIGVGMAVSPGVGSRVAVRSALAGVAMGVVGLVAVLVFVSSVDTLVETPARYGVPFDATVSGFSGDVLQEGDVDLLSDPRTARVGLGYSGLVRVGGEEVNAYALESLKGDLSFTGLAGDLPGGGAEVALGTSTLDAAGVEVGDEILVEGAGGRLRATVTGTAVFPVIDERSAPGRGVLMGRKDLESVLAPGETNADVVIKWADGVDPATANAQLAAATGTEIFAPRLPSDVNNLREVKTVPRALAGFLATLAAAAVVHALIATVRMRRQELAVLRALGFDERQLGSTVLWQAMTLGLLGIAVGVPLGIVAGRLSWQAVAGAIGVVRTPVVPAAAVFAVSLAVLIVAGVTGVLHSRHVRNAAVATLLQTP